MGAAREGAAARSGVSNRPSATTGTRQAATSASSRAKSGPASLRDGGLIRIAGERRGDIGRASSVRRQAFLQRRDVGEDGPAEVRADSGR